MCDLDLLFRFMNCLKINLKNYISFIFNDRFFERGILNKNSILNIL